MSTTTNASKEIEAAIRAEIECTFVRITDETDTGIDNGKFVAIVVADSFDGVGLLERHQRVNAALGALMKRIHAFSMKTWTPAQFDKKKAALGIE